LERDRGRVQERKGGSTEEKQREYRGEKSRKKKRRDKPEGITQSKTRKHRGNSVNSTSAPCLHHHRCRYLQRASA